MDKHFRDFEKRMFRLNSWVYLPPADMVGRHAWNRPCCYAIYADESLLYIGQTNNLTQRLAQHGFHETEDGYYTPWGIFKWIYAKAYYPKAYGFEAMLEKRLIKRLKPRANRYMLSGNHYGQVKRQRAERASHRG